MKVILTKPRADYLVDCVEHDRSIDPPPGGWTSEALIVLAGAAMAAAAAYARAPWSADTRSPDQHCGHEELRTRIEVATLTGRNLVEWTVNRQWADRWRDEVCIEIIWSPAGPVSRIDSGDKQQGLADNREA
jgi:hypothetical protein